MNNWRIFANSADLDAALARDLADLLRQTIAKRGSASLAVSGGSTPKGMFQQLSQYELAWDKVSVTLVDERWVDPEHPDSNERLVRHFLLRERAAAATFAGLKTAAKEPTAALDEVTARLAGLGLPFSAVVLGMGGDGHTASWFPGAANLTAMLHPAGEALVAATEADGAPHARLTLTLPAVLASERIALHITGETKRAVLSEALERALPVAAILQQNTTPVSIWWAP